jgi:TnpA family transposase
MLGLLELRATTQDETVLQAWRWIQRYQTDPAVWLLAELDLEFTSPRWRAQIVQQREGQVWHHHRQLELCVLSHVAAELRAGDLAVQDSRQYADLRDQMLPWTDCLPHLQDYGQRFQLPTSAQEFVRQLKRQLRQTARRVDRHFPENTQLHFDATGRPILKRVRARPVPAAVKAFQRELQKRMPARHLLDILVLAQRVAAFTRHFGPPSGADPKLAAAVSTHLLTLFAYGTNMGPEDLARHSLGWITARSLTSTNHQHVTAVKLDAALVDLINTYTHFDLPYYWGSGAAAAADGTLIDLYENNLLSARHVRYGGYGGIAYYHIADSYIALFSHFISVGVWEAVYIIDGLLHNDSEIQPETLHADTQGQSLPVFGLTYLLGIELMPRIRNWKDLIFYRPSAATRYAHIDTLFTETIDFALLETHWQDLMQVVLSILSGRLQPSTLLRKLGHHSRKNKLYRAFRELGRVVRTIFLLRLISDATLQRQVTVATNKVEAYHTFREWIAFGQDSRITSNDPVEMEKRIKYSDVLANALILQNVIDMTRIVHQLSQEGYSFELRYLSFLSPYWTAHVRRFGEYVLRSDLPLEEIIFSLPTVPSD